MTLTNIVNFPVSSSVRSGSIIGSNVYRPSCWRISSCCSNSATARCTSNLRANRNFNAVAGDMFFRWHLRLIISVNSLTACRKNRETEKKKLINKLKKSMNESEEEREREQRKLAAKMKNWQNIKSFNEIFVFYWVVSLSLYMYVYIYYRIER